MKATADFEIHLRRWWGPPPTLKSIYVVIGSISTNLIEEKALQNIKKKRIHHFR